MRVHSCAWLRTCTRRSLPSSPRTPPRASSATPHRHAVRRGPESYPSTEKQLDLLRLLARRARGDRARRRHDRRARLRHGDASVDRRRTTPPTIALFAHVDTAREVSGRERDPQRFRYEGGDIPLGTSGRDPARRSRRSSEHHVGHELITTDGTTLLGADDKAGHRGDHGGGRLSRRAPRRPARPGARSRSTPTRRSAAASSTSRSRPSARSPRTPSTARPPARCRSETFSGAQVRMTITRPRDPSRLGEGRARERDQARG